MLPEQNHVLVKILHQIKKKKKKSANGEIEREGKKKPFQNPAGRK